MQEKLFRSTIALAGIVQAVSLIRELAQTGKMNESAYQASIHSIFQTAPQNMVNVYGKLSGVKLGLEKLVPLFSGKSSSTKTIMRYVLSLIHLQKKVAASPLILDQLTQQIHQTSKQAIYFHDTHPIVITNLADAYLKTINRFRFRITIWGSHRSLSATDNMDKIRALLLAGLRSAFLWRQVGGSRLQFIFSRAEIKTAAKQILMELEKQKEPT